MNNCLDEKSPAMSSHECSPENSCTTVVAMQYTFWSSVCKEVEEKS